MKILSLLKEMSDGFKFDIGDIVQPFEMKKNGRYYFGSYHYKVIGRYHDVMDMLYGNDKQAKKFAGIISGTERDDDKYFWGKKIRIYSSNNIYKLIPVREDTTEYNLMTTLGTEKFEIESDLKLFKKKSPSTTN